jgi:guanylate kinase
MLFVMTGPSGCGKSTLVKRVLSDLEKVEFSVSFTTRKKRASEVEGQDYYFISEKEFKKMIQENSLAEWAEVHGNFYGTSRKELEKKGKHADLILDIDVQGAQQIKEKYDEAVFIFILPPVYLELRRRLEKRGGEEPETINRRLEVAKQEIKHYQEFDYIVVNDDFENAVDELKSVILSQRCRKERREKEILPIIVSFLDRD